MTQRACSRTRYLVMCAVAHTTCRQRRVCLPSLADRCCQCPRMILCDGIPGGCIANDWSAAIADCGFGAGAIGSNRGQNPGHYRAIALVIRTTNIQE
eukprot:2960845-Amphidinium_carterae.1